MPSVDAFLISEVALKFMYESFMCAFLLIFSQLKLFEGFVTSVECPETWLPGKAPALA